MGEEHPRRHVAVAEMCIALALAVVTAAVYAPVRDYGFLSYDDIDYVVDNPHVNAGLTREGFVRAWTGIHQATWHPLTTLSHMLDCQLFDLQPGPHHLGNVGLHVLNTLLLFGVFVRMTARPWRSAVVAALFALHPLHVESVAWISERKDVLSTFFWLLTVWCYVGYVRRPVWRRYAAVVAAYAAALLSKPMTVTLPFVLLLLDVWPLRRWHIAGQRSTAHDQSSPLALVIEKLPLMLPAAAVSVVTFFVQSHAAAVVPLADSPIADRIANAVVAYAGYLVHAAWPVGLVIFYPFEAPLPSWQICGAAALLIGISVAVWCGARRRPYLLVGWLWYLGMLVPVIGLVRIGDLAMADRYTYLPLVGIFVIVVWGLADFFAGAFEAVLGTTAAGGALVVCAAVTAWQVHFWKDSISLFQHALEVMPNNYVFHVNLGMALAEQGKDAAAFDHVAEAVRVKPSYPVAQYALGALLSKRGDRDAAKEHFMIALNLYPSYIQAHDELGRLLVAEGDLDGAMAHYREALRINPDLPDVHDNFGIALDTQGQHDAALAEYFAAVRLAPQQAAAQYLLGQALGIAGRFDEAAVHFAAALDDDPHLLEARYGLALAQAKAGHVRAAVAEFDQLVREQTVAPPVEIMLAWLLATADEADLRDGSRAVRLAADAVQRTSHEDPDALNSLAAAYAESGRFDDAVRVAEDARALARRRGRDALANALDDRLARYRAGQPARDLLRGTQP